MKELEAEIGLCLIILHIGINRPYRLVGAVFRKSVRIKRRTLSLDPIQHDVTLLGCKRAAPMHKVILRHRHAVVKNDLLNLCKIHCIHFAVHLDSLHELRDVICTISRIHILHHHLACNRKLCIERQFRICRMAAQAAAFDKDLVHALILRKISRRRLVDGPVDHNHRGSRHQQHNRAPFQQSFHKANAS